jgi:type I restriction enzyme S subunit
MKQGWEVKKLGDVCNSKSSNVSQNQLADEVGDYPIFGASGLIKNVSFYHQEKPYLSIVKDGSGFGRVTKMDAFTSVIGTLQYILPNDEIDLDYLNYSLMSVDFKKYVQGAAIPHIYFKDYKNEPFLFMPLLEQQRIVAILDDAFAKIEKAKANAEQNLKNAKELFESYLQGVFENKGEDWDENILKDVCEFKSGTTISPSLERTEGDVLYTKVGDMNLPDNEVEINTSSRFVNSREIKINQIIPQGAIIFPKRGGAIATNKKRKIIKPTIVDLNTMAIIPSKKIDKDYFFHWFQLFDLNSISNGANIPQINNYSFDEVNIPYPKSIREQQLIVQKLDTLSTETKKLEDIYQQKLKDLEELKKSALQKAFSGELK